MKQPYREPEPIHIDPPPKDFDFYYDRYAGKLLFTVAATFVAVMAYKAATYVPPPPKPCSEMAEVPAKDLPARCTKTYDADGGAS